MNALFIVHSGEELQLGTTIRPFMCGDRLQLLKRLKGWLYTETMRSARHLVPKKTLID